jgi:NADH-quinone oxidoreductase subunit M
MSLPFLSLSIWIPFCAGLALLFLPKSIDKGTKVFATLIASVVLAFSVAMLTRFELDQWQFQFVEQKQWVPAIGSSYHLGIDGISIWMVALTSFLALVAVLISNPTEKAKNFFGYLLILLSTLVGVFSALDLILFYVFFELSLVPVALMILGWGSGDRSKVAIKYLGVLFAGSLLMLVGIIALALQHQQITGRLSFSFLDIQNAVSNGIFWTSAAQLQGFCFWGFLIAFLVKSPAIPAHTWLADTYESAPIGAIVSGVVLKVGTYGIFRFCVPLFPDAVRQNAWIVTLIGVAGIIYGGVVAINQRNVHRLMAFSTVSHVGFILIGIFSLTHTGLMGAAFQQFNHGLASAAVFVLLGFLYQRHNTQDLEQIGGLKKNMPIFASLFLIAMLTNLGLPLTSGFVGEILALMGTFQAGFARLNGLNIGFAIIAGLGAIFSAAYMLYMFQRMFYGKSKSERTFADLNASELVIGGAFALLILVGGIFPTLILKRMEASVLATGASTKPGAQISWQYGNPGDVQAAGRTVAYRTAKGRESTDLYPQPEPDTEAAPAGGEH